MDNTNDDGPDQNTNRRNEYDGSNQHNNFQRDPRQPNNYNGQPARPNPPGSIMNQELQSNLKLLHQTSPDLATFIMNNHTLRQMVIDRPAIIKDRKFLEKVLSHQELSQNPRQNVLLAQQQQQIYQQQQQRRPDQQTPPIQHISQQPSYSPQGQMPQSNQHINNNPSLSLAYQQFNMQQNQIQDNPGSMQQLPRNIQQGYPQQPQQQAYQYQQQANQPQQQANPQYQQSQQHMLQQQILQSQMQSQPQGSQQQITQQQHMYLQQQQQQHQQQQLMQQQQSIQFRQQQSPQYMQQTSTGQPQYQQLPHSKSYDATRQIPPPNITSNVLSNIQTALQQQLSMPGQQNVDRVLLHPSPDKPSVDHANSQNINSTPQRQPNIPSSQPSQNQFLNGALMQQTSAQQMRALSDSRMLEVLQTPSNDAAMIQLQNAYRNSNQAIFNSRGPNKKQKLVNPVPRSKPTSPVIPGMSPQALNQPQMASSYDPRLVHPNVPFF